MNAYEKICDWMTRNNFKFFTDEDAQGNDTVDSQTFSASGVFARYGLTLLVRDDGYSESIVTTPLMVAEPFRNEMSEFFCRVAQGVELGNFAISFDDGSVVFETVMPTSQVMKEIEKTMTAFIDVPRKILDCCAAELVAVAFGTKSAEEAATICIGKLTCECHEAVEDVRNAEDLIITPPSETDVKSQDASQVAQKEVMSENLFPAYSLAGLNVSCGGVELETVVSAVSNYLSDRRPAVDRPRMSILITGDPGVGKTAFVRYLARRVDKLLHCIRASQILSSHVGETEKRLVDAFETAEAAGEILFIDEADSLLRTRTKASEIWEITQVNELLQLMENHNGVVICATNSDQLDSAAMRRFTFKLRLDYLKDESKVLFFKSYFGDELNMAERARLLRIDHLSVGDFRTVKEKLFYTCPNGATNQERLDALELEVTMKNVRPKIGF